MPNRILVHGVLFFVTFIYGANYTIAKFALPEYIQPFGFIALRVTGAIIIFWLIHSLRIDEKVERKDFLRLVACGLFGIAINQMSFFYGLSLTQPINAAIIMTISPIMVFVVAYLIGREKIRPLKILGLVIGATGAYLLITRHGISWQSDTFVGDLFILINATSYAIYLVLVKPLMNKYNPLTVIKWVFVFGAVIALPAGMEQLLEVSWGDLPDKAVFSLFYVVLGTTVLAYLLNAWALSHVDSSTVGVYMYLQPVLATVVAVALKEDSLELQEVLYSFIIMLGVYLVSKKQNSKTSYEVDGRR